MRVGSLVICINKKGWEDLKTGISTIGPAYNCIYTISGFPKPKYLTLEEFPDLDEDGDTENWYIEAFIEIQPPMEIKIESLIENEIVI